MSGLKGKVGKHELNWLSIPRGPSGQAHVEVGGRKLEVRWRKDDDGIWLELPDGVHGFDIAGERGDDGGLLYSLAERDGDGRWAGIAFSRAGEASASGSAEGKKKGTRIRAQMPGKIVRVLVKEGAQVEKDQPLLVIEAMKMENEIRALQAGTVSAVKVSEGQAVESGADLMKLD
jgi:acetyl/propionyl-CoA carboxylase alpha subunit